MVVGKVPLSKKVQCLIINYIRKNIVVCDGSGTDSKGIKNSFAANNIHYLQIHDGDLWVAGTDNPSIGFCHTVHKSGVQKTVFTEDGNQYCCIGAQPGRAERGVQSGLYRLKHRFPSEHWDSLPRL